MPRSASNVTPYVNALQEQSEKVVPRCFSTYPWNALAALFVGGVVWLLLSRPLPQCIGYFSFSILFVTVWLKHAGVVVTRNRILLKDYYTIYKQAADTTTNSYNRRKSEGPCGVPIGCCN